MQLPKRLNGRSQKSSCPQQRYVVTFLGALDRSLVDANYSQRALANQPWKEYTAEGGRKYWYNTETKQSSWEMPDAYKKALGSTGTPTTPA